MGNPLEETTQVGPITTQPQYEKVLDYIDIAKQRRREVRARRRPGAATGVRRRLVRRADDLHRRDNRRCGSRRKKCSARCCRSSRSKRRGSARDRQRFDLRPCGRRLDVEHRPRAEDGDELEAGTVWVNTYRASSYAVAVRRLQALGLRPRERPARDPRVRAGEERVDRDDGRGHAEPVRDPLTYCWAGSLFAASPGAPVSAEPMNNREPSAKIRSRPLARCAPLFA